MPSGISLKNKQETIKWRIKDMNVLSLNHMVYGQYNADFLKNMARDIV